MKPVLFLSLIVTSLSSLFAVDIQTEPKFKFQNKIVETITFKEGKLEIDFKILCINGYQYLYRFGSGAPIQMFSTDKKSRQSVPIGCNGFEDSDEK